MIARTVYVAGTYDTKGKELRFVAERLRTDGHTPILVDLSTSADHTSDADVTPQDVAKHHADGASAVFTGDRGESVGAMTAAFEAFITSRRDVEGIFGAGGSGGTALVTPAMRALPVGIPKVMVSTVASGNVAPYVGASDIMMMPSITDVAGLNRISRVILANAAHALSGMLSQPAAAAQADKPAVGLTMFGVTTPCVNQMAEALESDYDCLVFHATGVGGQSMEKLVDSGFISGVIDSTTTEVCDLLFGGILAATEDRFGAIARTRVPYVGSCGALDMVNFGARDTVPDHYADRNLYVHNPQITLMRTTAEENRHMGEWIGNKLNACEGEVRFFLPEGGVSMLDAPDMPFHDPEADAALFEALEATVRQTDKRRLIRLPHNVNDQAFSDALVAAYREIA